MKKENETMPFENNAPSGRVVLIALKPSACGAGDKYTPGSIIGWDIKVIFKS